MWQSIPSLNVIWQGLSGVFTAPSLRTCQSIFLAWVMCPGKRTEYKVFETIHVEEPISRDQRHPFDRYYNFYSRSAWKVCELSRELAREIVNWLPYNERLYFLIDDTLLHKTGENVYGLGWFYDAVASTESRTVTATGNNWVVLGIAIPIPGLPDRFICLPLQARLHLAGDEHPSCQDLAAEMVQEIAGWFPDREICLLGDGGYSAHQLLENLPENVTHVGLMRMDAELYDPEVPPQPKSKRGPKPQKGPRLDSPKQMFQQAEKGGKKGAAAKKAKTGRARGKPGSDNEPGWQKIETTAYGERRTLLVYTRLVLWPRVTGLRKIRIVLIHDPEGELADKCLFTTNVDATAEWVITTYARRNCIEQAFRASKQYLQIESPHHWCQQSIEKLAPWVWLMQSVVILWYLTEGRHSSQAEARRQRMGAWDSEWSLRHMLQTLRDAVLEETIRPMLSKPADQRQLIQLLTNCLKLAV